MISFTPYDTHSPLIPPDRRLARCCSRTQLTRHRSWTHGFTGYRSRINAFYLDPVLPPQLSNYTVKGMKWGGGTFDVTLGSDHTTIRLRSYSHGSIPVEIGPSNAKAGN